LFGHHEDLEDEPDKANLKEISPVSAFGDINEATRLNWKTKLKLSILSRLVVKTKDGR